MNLSVLPGMAGQVRLVEASMPPPPCSGEVLVRMLRAPVNPADLLAIDGRYSFDLGPELPLGAEGTAMVETVGEGVTDLSPGDKVLLLSRGNWCRYRCVRRSHLIALPPDKDMTQAAMLRINPPTARLLLQATGAGPGDIIVQNGAASMVATWVRALAAPIGISVINVVRRAAGALPDALVDGDDLADRVKMLAAGRPVSAALDCVAGTATGRMAECLAPGGRLILFGHLSGEPISVRSQMLTGGGLSISGFSLRPAEAAMGGDAMEVMFSELMAFHLRSGIIFPVRDILPLSQAQTAIAQARLGGRGRVLLDLTQ